MSQSSKLFDRFPRLTDREVSVALLISEGKSNSEIGASIGIAEKTVKNVNMSVSLKMDVEPGGSSRVRIARKVWHTVHGIAD